MITRAQQQQNGIATQFDSLEFFAHRVEEYGRTKCSNHENRRITHKKFA